MSVSAEDQALMERAQEYYAEHLREVLEPEHNGELIAIDPDLGLYAVGTDPIALHDDLKSRGSVGLHALLRVGYNWTFEMLGKNL